MSSLQCCSAWPNRGKLIDSVPKSIMHFMVQTSGVKMYLISFRQSASYSYSHEIKFLRWIKYKNPFMGNALPQPASVSKNIIFLVPKTLSFVTVNETKESTVTESMWHHHYRYTRKGALQNGALCRALHGARRDAPQASQLRGPHQSGDSVMFYFLFSYFKHIQILFSHSICLEICKAKLGEVKKAQELLVQICDAAASCGLWSFWTAKLRFTPR